MAQLGAQCVKVHVCMQAHLPMSEQRMALGCLPFSISPVFLPFFFFPSLFLRQVSHRTWSSPFCLNWLDSKPPEQPVSITILCTITPGLYWGSKDPNSGPQALCPLSHLPDPSSQVSLRQEPPAIPNRCWDSSCPVLHPPLRQLSSILKTSLLVIWSWRVRRFYS